MSTPKMKATPEPQPDYTPADLVAGLRAVGLKAGDVVYVQNCGESLGAAEGCATDEDVARMMIAALREVIGPQGTLLVSTYTFSLCRREIFDPDETPAVAGVWSSFLAFMETFRRMPGVIRSPDPIFAVAGLGPRTAEILENPGNSSLGVDSVHDRLRKAGGKICMIGIGLFESTFRHHVEEMVGVPWRFKKLFTGSVRRGGKLYKVGRVYNVRIMAKNGDPAGEALEALARSRGLCRAAAVGRNEVVSIESQAYFDLGMQKLRRDPWFTAKGPAGDPVVLEEARVGGSRFDVALPPDASMEQMIDTLWRLPRNIVSDGFDAALGALADQLPITVHEYPSGTEAWSWVVPEKWACREAYLETMDGRRLFSYADHQLHVVSYSLPFEGVVEREELLRHLHVHPKLPDAIPFVFKYYERDWGLCCTRETRDALADERYRVVIRTDFSYGTMKVGEVVARGRTDDTIVLCVHLCHPHQVNDDLTGVVVAVDVMRELLRRRDLRYTYRLLIVPETIGSVAYLSQNEALLPLMKGGLFLEMLGKDSPHGLQLSFTGETEIDRCLSLVLKTHDPNGYTGPFRSLILNDEVQFNAPGARVPMLSLSRVHKPGAPDWPFRGYHSSHDTPESISIARLAESRDLTLKMIDALEKNLIPVNTTKGEVFCSRYGLHIDWYANPEGNRAFSDVLHLVDGTRSVAEIATTCGIPFESAKGVIDALVKCGLAEYRE
ncbi:MAG: DUF4910 domain-containing protein [Thermoanaerobaculia bacterium]